MTIVWNLIKAFLVGGALCRKSASWAHSQAV